MKIVFTDLDGTLLDENTYSWEAALPGIQRLRECKVPWVLVTSKTWPEVEWWRTRLHNRHPFIVENGGAAFIPHGYFGATPPATVRRKRYDVLEWGRPYCDLTTGLTDASQHSRCRTLGFREMTAAEISYTCKLSLQQATFSKLREYDEAFWILDLERTGQLLNAIEKQGLRWTKGGRFWHVTGNNDKGQAVLALQRFFLQAYGRIETIGLGDAVNDAAFLRVVDVPILIRSRGSAKLQAAVPDGILTERSGPSGWSEAILQVVRPAWEQREEEHLQTTIRITG